MTTNVADQVRSDLPIPPGELLAEELDAVAMTQQELAKRTGRPVQAINEIVRGKKQMTHETALELEKVLGIPAHIWSDLESQYQSALARQRDNEELLKQEDRLKDFPVREMERRGWIAKTGTKTAAVRELLRFFGVASFNALKEWNQSALGFPITGGSRVSAEALAAWLRKAEIDGRDIETRPYSRTHFRAALTAIRALTNEPPRVFAPRMQELCAAAGVALVFVPGLPRSGANGCARWLSRDKALIALSLQYKTNDHFWFSFFHEGCHVLKHRMRSVFIDGIGGARDPEEEQEADAFARDFLIPPKEWARFIQGSSRSAIAVRRFAEEVGIAPGIVVGRLEHDRHISSGALHQLKVKFAWTDRVQGDG
jgi:HTH-type transcriptional regulator / antitoxin HigA